MNPCNPHRPHRPPWPPRWPGVVGAVGFVGYPRPSRGVGEESLPYPTATQPPRWPGVANEPLAHEGLTGLTGVRLWGPWGLCPHAKQLPPTAERVVGAVEAKPPCKATAPIPSNPHPNEPHGPQRVCETAELVWSYLALAKNSSEYSLMASTSNFSALSSKVLVERIISPYSAFLAAKNWRNPIRKGRTCST